LYPRLSQHRAAKWKPSAVWAIPFSEISFPVREDGWPQALLPGVLHPRRLLPPTWQQE